MSASLAAVIALLTGAAVMGLELTAVRLMAPHFGDSAYVWTNVIGVILVAMALGAFLGGRLADRGVGMGRLAWLLAVAGLLVSLVPIVAVPLGSFLVPAEMPMDAAMGALVRGSLAATTLLFAPPILLVACASPMLVTSLAADGSKVGKASGLISAMATVGSLIGTFAATHLLIPMVGSQVTVWICAGLLFVAALCCRRTPALAAGLLAPLILPFVAPDGRKAVGPAETLVAEVESNYQFLQVVDVVDSDPKQRSLKINEGLDSFHSVHYEGTAYTNGNYYDYHAVAPFLARDGGDTAGARVLSLGEAAGTFGRLFAHVHPKCEMDGVEIDPEVMRLGDEFFAGKRLPGKRYAVDARVFVNQTSNRYDVVLVDTYKNQIYIPAHVASEQFFRSVHAVLRDGGVVSVNSGGARYDDPVVRALGTTMAKVFGEAWAFRVPQTRNFVLAARKAKPLDPSCLAKVATDDPALRGILARTANAAFWRRVSADGETLSDDRPFLDVLQQEAYSQRAAVVALTAVDGSRNSKDVEQEVEASFRGGHYEEALAKVAEAEAATPRLRRRAGDCRWILRDTSGAVAEYDEAKRLGFSDAGIDRDLGFAREEVASRQVAWDASGRNGWIAGSALLLLFAGFFVARVRT